MITHIPKTIAPDIQKLESIPFLLQKLDSRTKYGMKTRIMLCQVPKKNQDQNTFELKSLLCMPCS